MRDTAGEARMDKFISDILLWTPSHRHASVGQPTKTYLQQQSMDTGCSLEDLLEATDDREEWQEIIREICACSMTSRWGYIHTHTLYIYIYNK